MNGNMISKFWGNGVPNLLCNLTFAAFETEPVGKSLQAGRFAMGNRAIGLWMKIPVLVLEARRRRKGRRLQTPRGVFKDSTAKRKVLPPNQISYSN